MPYISLTRRDELKPDTGAYRGAENPGELNFLFTEIIIDYLNENNFNYQTINDIIGALEGAKLEFYRRVALPYEDGKIASVGDVYPRVIGMED